jgi:hypothetical protein
MDGEIVKADFIIVRERLRGINCCQAKPRFQAESRWELTLSDSALIKNAARSQLAAVTCPRSLFFTSRSAPLPDAGWNIADVL